MKQSASFQGLNIDKNSIINLEKGKLPPQAIDLEEVVLGAMMIDKKWRLRRKRPSLPHR